MKVAMAQATGEGELLPVVSVKVYMIKHNSPEGLH
jgi:hypothetical protein